MGLLDPLLADDLEVGKHSRVDEPVFDDDLVKNKNFTEVQGKRLALT